VSSSDREKSESVFAKISIRNEAMDTIEKRERERRRDIHEETTQGYFNSDARIEERETLLSW
jgi:hypothetical protein